ncbi:MAG: HEPN domain-containing protein [Candidatus Omnitrophota bacterium]|jgi:HEPN domain-containing protein
MGKDIVETDKPPSNFLKQADDDYLATRLLFLCGSGFHGLSAYHSQQCLEKYIKTYTVQEAKIFIKTHDLEGLREMATNYNVYFSKDEIKKQLVKFNVYDQVTRYGAESTYDPHHVKNGFIEIAGSWFFSGEHIKILDKLVYEIRGLLNFGKINWPDTFKAILEDRKEVMMVATWRLPIAIKKILTVGNEYYK